MLSDYIVDYVEAKNSGDEKLATKIEKDLEMLGMDKYTLTILAKEFMRRKVNDSMGK